MGRICPVCKSEMEIRIRRLLSPPELGAGRLQWYCPKCGHKEPYGWLR